VDIDGMREELAAIRARMAAVKAEVTADVEANWTSNWRNPDLVAIKAETRLSSHQEYRELITRARETEAALAAAEAG
jgi:hypothetical protein